MSADLGRRPLTAVGSRSLRAPPMDDCARRLVGEPRCPNGLGKPLLSRTGRCAVARSLRPASLRSARGGRCAAPAGRSLFPGGNTALVNDVEFPRGVAAPLMPPARQSGPAGSPGCRHGGKAEQIAQQISGGRLLRLARARSCIAVVNHRQGRDRVGLRRRSARGPLDLCSLFRSRSVVMTRPCRKTAGSHRRLDHLRGPNLLLRRADADHARQRIDRRPGQKSRRVPSTIRVSPDM
jgi:hypothetical protein